MIDWQWWYLLVSVNQSSYLIYVYYIFFQRAKKIWNKIEVTKFADIDLLYFSNFISKKNVGFVEEHDPWEKFVIVEEELNGIDMDDIKNL